MQNLLCKPHCCNEKDAFAYLESILWKNGKVCKKCGNCDAKKIYKISGKSARNGLHKCGMCKKQFTITVGTIFEGSHIPLYKWFQAITLISSSKKGFSAFQLHRILGVARKTAWFMAMRIREIMNENSEVLLGGEGKIVESDETFFGNATQKKPTARGWAHKNKILALVERKGRVKSFHITDVNVATIKPILKQMVCNKTTLMTDDATWYKGMKNEFASHESVAHSLGEYARGNVNTNTIEGYFGIFKRGMKGIYQHCKSHHLKRYLAEFEFRYNHRQINDAERIEVLVANTIGKRLMYRDSFIAQGV